MKRASRRSSFLGVLTACLVITGSFAAPDPDRVEPDLDQILAHLDRFADLFRDNALRFACNETITYAKAGKKKEVLRYDYIYVYEDERLADYRTRRGGSRKKEPVVVSPNSQGLPYFLERAYSWIFIFERAKREMYRYRILGEEKALGRDAVVVEFEPIPPYREDLNDWFGTAWIDRETHQILRVEAMKSREHEEKKRFQMALETPLVTQSSTLGDYTFTTVSTEFSVVEKGMRLPGKVVAAKSKFKVWEGKEKRGFTEHPLLHVTQKYDHYRFFGVSAIDTFRGIITSEN